MSETIPSQTKPKKLVSKSVVIALGIICIVLLVALGGALANYNRYVSNHHNTDDQCNSLQNQVNNLYSIINLGKQQAWIDSQNVNLVAGGAAEFNAFSADYAGYIAVIVQGAASGSPHIIVDGDNAQNNVLFSVDEPLHGGAETIVPILSGGISIRVVNEGNQATALAVTIIYHY